METHAEHEIHYEVDAEDQTTTKKILTPVEILTKAGIDAATHYLVQVKGHHQESYKDTPDLQVHVHAHMKFISISTGPTPVS